MKLELNDDIKKALYTDYEMSRGRVNSWLVYRNPYRDSEDLIYISFNFKGAAYSERYELLQKYEDMTHNDFLIVDVFDLKIF